MKKNNVKQEAFRNSHGARSFSKHDTDDDYSTPNWATDILLRNFKFDGPIWECACGSGKLSKRLLYHKYKVISTTLVNRGYGSVGIDFLKQKKLLAPNIVTNPPYNILFDFVIHALSSKADVVALLLRTAFLESKKRREMLDIYKPSMVIVITDRVLFDGSENPGGGYFLSWFIWNRKYKGETILRIDYKK